MAEVEPLVHSGYVGVSNRPPAKSMYVLLTPKGRAYVEHDFTDLPDLPPAQIITVLAQRVDSVAVSQHGNATINTAQVDPADRERTQHLLAELAERIERSDLPPPEKADAQATAVQLSAELTKSQPKPARLGDLALDLRYVTAGFGFTLLVKALDALMNGVMDVQRRD